jgi:pyruvate formate lyase activating enzyme
MSQVRQMDKMQAQVDRDQGRQGVVFNIMRYSVADGPGLRTTVFLKGCPLTCPWCHNPESQEMGPQLIHRADRCLGCEDCLTACPHGAISPGERSFITDTERCNLCRECLEACPTGARDDFGEVMSVDRVMSELLKDLPFYEQSGGGVTFSGGEPLMQPKFLLNLLKESKLNDLHTAVDTSGCVDYHKLDEIGYYVDLFLYDLKVMDNVRHRKLVGISNQGILGNLERLIAEGHKVMVRMPLVPGVNDSPGDIEQAAAYLANLKPSHGVELLPFHPTAEEKYRLLGREPYRPPAEPPDDAQLEALARIVRKQGLSVVIGGKSDESESSQTS